MTVSSQMSANGNARNEETKAMGEVKEARTIAHVLLDALQDRHIHDAEAPIGTTTVPHLAK